MNKCIKKAIAICKSQQALANAVGVSQMTISMWLRGHGISSCYVPAIVKATKGKVTYQEICDELEQLALQKKHNKG